MQALAELAQAVAPLRSDWPGLRWASQDRWHVTLAFLGEVDQGKLENLRERLGRAAGRHRAGQLHIGRGMAFPSPARARVLCTRIDGERQALTGLSALAASVAAGARRAGAPPPDEGRRYRPHVTLARSREPTDLRPLVQALSGLQGAVWTAEHVDLILSHAGPRPHYETIASWPLRPPQSTGRPGPL